MNLSEAVAISSSSLWVHKLRSVLTLIGVAAVIAVVGLINGANQYVATRGSILAQFLIEAVTLSAVGGVIGVLFGSALSLLTLRLEDAHGSLFLSETRSGQFRSTRTWTWALEFRIWTSKSPEVVRPTASSILTLDSLLRLQPASRSASCSNALTQPNGAGGCENALSFA